MTTPIVEMDPERYLRVLGDAYRKHYEQRTDEWTDDEAMRCVPAVVQDQLGLAPSACALDVGCGSGSDVRYLSEIVGSVVGIDIVRHPAWGPIVEARRPRVSFSQVDLLSYEPGDRYDLILDNGCFHHQHEEVLVPYLRKSWHLLAPSGWLVLSTFKNPAVNDFIDVNGRVHRYFSDDELHHEIGAAGLTVVRQLAVRRGGTRGHYRLSFCRRHG